MTFLFTIYENTHICNYLIYSKHGHHNRLIKVNDPIEQKKHTGDKKIKLIY